MKGHEKTLKYRYERIMKEWDVIMACGKEIMAEREYVVSVMTKIQEITWQILHSEFKNAEWFRSRDGNSD